METKVRTYQETHPWLTFSINLERAPARLWIVLGECQSKCEHISGVPLPPDTARKLHLLYFAKGVTATAAIEGNTLSEADVQKQLQGELEVPPSREYLKQETQNIIDECNWITQIILEGKPLVLSTDRIKQINGIVLDKLELKDGIAPGRIRMESVGVGRYRGAPAKDCEYLLDRLCEWLNSETFSPEPGMEIVYAIIKAVMAHLYLAWIHPFDDGNGRTARLVEFQILLSSGVPSPVAHLLSNHYNATRSEYYLQLDRASRSGGDVIPFLTYSCQGLLDGLVSQLGEIRSMQLDIMWREFVFAQFETGTPAKKRRRDLLLDLSKKTEPVPYSEIPIISKRMAEAYRNRQERTIKRDLGDLLKRGYIKLEGKGYRACKESILAFLPVKAKLDPCLQEEGKSN